jgi:hypothetical protein
MLHLTQTVYLSCTDTNTCLQTDRHKIPHDPRHLGVLSSVSKIIFEPVVSSAQTVHLSCVKISTISKRTESSFHLSLVTYENHGMRPKLFLSLWYVCHKPWTYLSLTLTQSPITPKEDSTRPTSPRCSIECFQNILILWYVQRKPCTYLAPRLALSLNEPKRASTRASSPTWTFGCVQNKVLAYCTFGANHAPILYRH